MFDFSDLPVSLTLWIVSQVFMFFALVTIVISLQVKNKRNLLFLIGVCYVFFSLNLIFLQDWIVLITILVALCRNFVFAFFEHCAEKGKPLPKWVGQASVVFFIVALIVPTIFLWTWWFDWILIAGSIPIIIGAYFKGTHLLRVAIMVKAALNIINFVIFVNIIGIIFESFVIGSSIVFYIRLLVSKKRKTRGKQCDTMTT